MPEPREPNILHGFIDRLARLFMIACGDPYFRISARTVRDRNLR